MALMIEPAIRRGRLSDQDAITRIYDHYVTTTHVTFDLEPPDAEQRRSWFEQFSDTGRHQLFVADAGDGAVGYACSTPFKPPRLSAPRCVDRSRQKIRSLLGCGLVRKVSRSGLTWDSEDRCGSDVRQKVVKVRERPW